MTGRPSRARLGRLPARDISLALPAEVLALVNRAAAEAGLARSNWLRQIVLRELGFVLPEPRA